MRVNASTKWVLHTRRPMQAGLNRLVGGVRPYQLRPEAATFGAVTVREGLRESYNV